MPPRAHVVRIQPHVTATGIWCDHCALPSRLQVALLNVDTLNVLARYQVCDNCGRHETLR